MRAMDQGAIEGAMDGASGGSGRVEGAMDVASDGCCKRWITVQYEERWMVQAMDQRAIGRAMGASSD